VNCIECDYDHAADNTCRITKEQDTDASGVGVTAKRALVKHDLVYEDVALLSHPYDEPFGYDQCAAWFNDKLDDAGREGVLALKRCTNADSEGELAAMESALREADAADGDKADDGKSVEVLRALAVVRANAFRSGDKRVLCPVLCRLNHSCRPNLIMRDEKVFALRNISEGEELCWCYPQAYGCSPDASSGKKTHFLFLCKNERCAHLQKTYEFTCVCERCQEQDADDTNESLQQMQNEYGDIQAMLDRSEQVQLDEDEWESLIDMIRSLEDNMQKHGLHCPRLLSQFSQIKATCHGYRLLNLDTRITRFCSQRSKSEADVYREWIELINTSNLEALRNSCFSWGEDDPSTQSLLSHHKQFIFGKMLRQYGGAGYGR
jgi:hypothetical protein